MDPDHYWATIAGACTAVGIAVRWWYHVRRLENADKVDGGVSRSIRFVIDELRTELERLKTENAALRTEIEELRKFATSHHPEDTWKLNQ